MQPPEKRRIHAVLAIFLGLLGAFALFVVVDVIYAFVTHADFVVPSIHVKKDNYSMNLGYRPMPNVPQKHVAIDKRDGRVAFDVTYYFDSYGRRAQDPAAALPPRKRRPAKHALFFVDSNVFGEGLAWENTIPTVFEAELPEYRSYNYAYRGYGPQQMLGRLEPGGILPGEIHEPTGVAIYLYSSYHLSRANGFFSTMMWAGGKHPDYELDAEGRLVSHGPFSETQPRWSMAMVLLSYSSLLRGLNVEIPPVVTAAHLDITCAIIHESSRRYEALHPKNRFIVVLAPQVHQDAPMRSRCFGSPGLEVLDLEKKNWPYQELYFAHDGHFSEKGARLVAGAIAEYLKLPPPVRPILE